MKKGISPLIATVLLIGTTIVIAAMVSTFIISQTKKFDPEKMMGESEYCQDVVLSTKIVGETNEVNCDSNQMPRGCKRINNLGLVNKGLFSVWKVDVSADGLGSGEIDILKEQGISPDANDAKDFVLKPGKVMCEGLGGCDVPVRFIPGVCSDNDVRIVPHIKVEGEEIVCSQSEMVINANICD